MRIKTLGLIVLASALGTSPCDAEAYCVENENLVVIWSSDFPDLRIPVWVSTSAEHSVEFTGQTTADIARLAIEVIARHNESNRTPKLYFAGFTTKEYEPLETKPVVNLPAGITLMSATTCENYKTACQNQLPAGCANRTTRGVHPMMPMSAQDDPIGWVFLSPPNCGVINYSLTDYADMAQVILHEIGHTLGLRHSNREKAVCENGGKNVHSGPPMGTVGVMNSAVPASFATYRTWRRDDLEGLEHLYGAAANAFELAWWDDTNYPDYPAEAAATSLIDMSISRTAIISNRAPSGQQALVTTTPDGRVVHRLLNDAGAVTPSLTDIVVDPSPSGVTWALPAVAMSGAPLDERIFVVWLADEAQDSNLLTLRTAMRSANDLNWTYSNHPDPFVVNRLSAGYDPDAEVFVVVTMTATAEVQIVLFDIDGAALGSAILLESLQAFGVGAPLCDDGRCLLPFSEPAFGGPDFGIAEVLIDPRTPNALLISTEVLNPVSTYGGLALVHDGGELLGGTGERRFFLGDYPGLTPDGAELDHNPDTDWALGLGVWGTPNSSTTRLFQPRSVICGNGIAQASEQCDDGNVVPSDGCDSCVVVEPGTDSESDSDSESGGTGGGSSLDDSGNGCECRAAGSAGSSLGFAAMFGIVTVTLRSRRRV